MWIEQAIAQGVESKDFFAYASGKEEDKYLGFAFGRGTLINLDDSSLLILREQAEKYVAALPPEHGVEPEPPIGGGDEPVPDTPPIAPPVPGITKSLFYGTTNLNPVSAKLDFATIVDEVVQNFTSKLGVEVSISVEIQAKSQEGFDESVQRTVRENCNQLKFGTAEFEEGS